MSEVATERCQRVFTVEGQPVPAVRMTQRSKFVSKQAQRYLAFKAFVALTYLQSWGGDAPLNGPVTLSVTVHLARPQARRWDASNVLKGFEDALNTLAYHDDRQITVATIEVVESADGTDYTNVFLEGE